MQSRGMIIGGSTVLLSDGGRKVLVPGLNDVIVVVQIKDSLQLIVNGRDKHSLTAAESRTFTVRGNTAKVYTDRSVSIPIGGLQGGPAPGPSASAKERLVHARQKSGALSGVIARQRVAEELMKDPFLIGVANLILRLCQFFGVPVKAPRAPKTPADLARLFADAAKTLEFQVVCKPLPDHATSKSTVEELAEESLHDLLQSIIQSLQELPNRSRESAQPDLNPLASQLMEALRRLVFETAQKPALAPGQWPAESKKLIPGVDAKTMMLLCDSWNHALIDKDDASLANLILNEDALLVLSPEEKVAVIERITALPPDAPQFETHPGMHYINRILQSASEAQEYRSIFAATANKIRGRTIDAPSWQVQRTATDFDIAAGAFGVDVAVDSSIAAIARDAAKAGHPANRILQARREVHEARRQPDELERIIQDPLKMQISTPTEKSELIQDLLKGQASTRSARAIVTVLLSSKDAGEYEAVCAQAGGAEIGKKLKDPEARRKWDLLAGAMGRMDLALESSIAAITQKCLLDRAAIQKQQQEWESVKSPPAPALSYDPLKKLVQEEVARSMERMNTGVRTCDSRTLAEGILTNTERKKQGKPEWNPIALRWEAHMVLREQKTDKEKKKRLEELNKNESVYTLRNVIYPILFLYSWELRALEKFGESIVGALDDKLAREGLRSGPESTSVNRIQMNLDRVSSVLDPVTYVLTRAVSILEAVYPAPREWYEKN